MAKCDEGYFCSVCGHDVADLTVSDLYLRFVTGILDAEVLHLTPERHIRCNPILAQFIVHPEFPPVEVAADFAKSLMDPESRAARESLITRGWLRLRELRELLQQSEYPVTRYPLPEFWEAPD